MTKKELLDEWKEKIKLGILYQSEFGKTEKWELYEKYYRNQYGKDILPVNLIFAFGRSMVPRVYYRNPKVVITPLKPGFTLNAVVTQRLANWLIDETGVKAEMKKLIPDGFLYGNGIGKIGYDSEFGYDVGQVSEVVEGEGTLTSFDKKEEYIEYNVNVKPGMPWFLRSRPIDFIVPWGCADVHRAPWVAFRVMRPLADIKADDKYADKKDLKATKIITCEGATGDVVYEKLCEKEEWVELWEIRDLKTRKIYTITMLHDKFLREDVDELQIEGIPVETLTFNADPVSFWGISDCQIIEPQQLEINEIRTQAKAHREIALLKFLAVKDVLSKADKKKLLSGDVGPFVELETNLDIKSVLSTMTPHVPPELGPLGNIVIEDVRHMLGFNRNVQGEYMTGRRTATEAKIVQMGAEIRVDERRDIAADLLKRIVKRYLQFVFTFWRDKKKIIDVIGADGMRHWIEYTGEQIKGEYMYRVDPENSMPITSMSRREEAKELYGLTKGDPTVNPVAMTKQLLQQYDWLEPELLLMPQQSGWGNNPEQPMGMQDTEKQVMQNIQRRKTRAQTQD